MRAEVLAHVRELSNGDWLGRPRTARSPGKRPTHGFSIRKVHAGLPDWYPGEQPGPLADRLTRRELFDRVLHGGAPAEILGQKEPKQGFVGVREGFALWVRMLFSCLVDADFLDTEAFM